MRLLYLETDDVVSAQQLHAEMRREAGHDVAMEVVDNLEDALTGLRAESFQCILLGVNSADAQLLKLTDALMANADGLPLIALVGSHHDAVELEAMELGVQDCLLKGELHAGTLLRRLRFAVERRRYGAAHPRQVAASRPHHAVATAAAPLQNAGTLPAMPSTDQDHGDNQTPQRPVRVLQVEDDAMYARLVEKRLCGNGPDAFEVDRVGDLAEALKRLVEDAYDAILLDLSLPDCEGLDTMATIRQYADDAPILVVTGHDDEELAVEGIQKGADDFLFKTHLDTRQLAQSIRMAVARKRKANSVFDREKSRQSVAAAEGSNRRKHQRFLLTRPIFAVPLLPGAQPDGTHHAEGFTIDVSAGGMGFEIHGLDRLPSNQLLVGLEADDGVYYFATVEVRFKEVVESGIRIGARFAAAGRDVLRRENLLPTLNAKTYRFETGLPTETLNKWCEFGIFRPILMDRVLVCPECKGAPTFRDGCRSCGSVRVATSQLIHHFACAHVGFVSDFESGDEMVCPKCRSRGLIVGADFEHLDGPYRCLDCDWSDTELEIVAQCLGCQLRFPVHEAVEEELIGYHVNRLDPLALVPDA